ncbi:MAG: hypothetical protein JSV88_27460 [Candidatus Aminicenantes bacterium]|nr:MAG: hypothetical protein JSV88_27460 [Candidatus Aminicenantes bacterium]
MSQNSNKSCIFFKFSFFSAIDFSDKFFFLQFMVTTRFILTDSKRVVNIFLEFVKIKKEVHSIDGNPD